MTTTTQKKSNVEIKVLAVNTLYEYAEKYILHEYNRLKPLIGLDIFKVDGSFKAKYDAPKLSDKLQLADGTWVNAHYWFNNNKYGFDIHVKICVNGGSYDVTPTTAFCQYQEQSFTLFEKDENGRIKETNTDRQWLKKRYDVAELNAISAEIKQAAKEYEKTYDKMPHLFKDVYYIERLSRN